MHKLLFFAKTKVIFWRRGAIFQIKKIPIKIRKCLTLMEVN